MVADVEVGDNFAVVAEKENLEGADFYISKCLKPLHVMCTNVGPDAYGIEVEQRDEVLLGQYFARKGSKKTSHVLDSNKGPAFVYSHHVCASKFSMKQCAHK